MSIWNWSGLFETPLYKIWCIWMHSGNIVHLTSTEVQRWSDEKNARSSCDCSHWTTIKYVTIKPGIQWNFGVNSIISPGCQRLAISYSEYVLTCCSQTADKQMPSRESNIQSICRGVDKSLAWPTSWCVLFDGKNILFNACLVIYINSTNIPPIMFINRIYETQNLLSL